MLEEVQGCPAKTAISAISAISPKIGEIAVLVKINKVECYGKYKGAQQKLRFLQNLRKIGEFAVFAKTN